MTSFLNQPLVRFLKKIQKSLDYIDLKDDYIDYRLLNIERICLIGF